MPCLQMDKQAFTVLNLSIVTFLVLLGLSMVSPILPSYAESFQVSYTLVGFAISSFAVARMVLDIPAGFLSKRYDKKMIMISGLVVIVIASIIAALATSYDVLLLARIIEGAGSALYVTPATVFLAQAAGTKKRGKLMGLYSGMLLLGSIFGPSFGGFIATIYNIRAPFYAYALVVGLGVIPTLALPKLTSSEDGSPSEKRRPFVQDVWRVLSHPSFLLGTFATFTLFFARTGVRSTVVPLFAANDIGLDSGAIGLVLTFAGITTAATMVPMGSLSDKIGRRNPLIVCLLLSAVVTLGIPYSHTMLELSICMAAYGAVIGLSGPIAAYVTDVSPQDRLEVSMGLYRMISDLGFVVGPLLLGYLADISGTPVYGAKYITKQIGLVPFAFASVVMVVAGLVLLKAEDPVRSRNARSQ
jgi:DHA1 family multidrug resistance protein-like MFS transporter